MDRPSMTFDEWFEAWKSSESELPSDYFDRIPYYYAKAAWDHQQAIIDSLRNIRPRWNDIYMDLAVKIALRSTCARLKVGCVVTSMDNKHVLGIGYNGNASGGPNTCDRQEPGNCGCLHAEDNALLKVHAPESVEKKVYITHAPCSYCAKRLINKGGIKQVLFGALYKSEEGILLLTNHSIECLHHKEGI